jgi:hypothetical protein
VLVHRAIALGFTREQIVATTSHKNSSAGSKRNSLAYLEPRDPNWAQTRRKAVITKSLRKETLLDDLPSGHIFPAAHTVRIRSPPGSEPKKYAAPWMIVGDSGPGWAA